MEAAIKLVFMIAFLAKTTLSAQNSIIPYVIAPGAEPGSQCPLQEERDIAQQSLRSAVLDILRQNNSSTVNQSSTITDNCGPGQWYRVAYLNMSDSTQECPSNWMEISTPVRTCGRPTSHGPSCSGEYFSNPGSIQYRKVCGRVVGYQRGSTDTFALRTSPQSIDDPYVDGVSVTHGMPRTHIWTYAAGGTEATVLNYVSDCPCADPAANTTPAPSFVGDDYYCESGNSGGGSGGETFWQGDPVWDGEQCEGECCSNGKSPPWFSVTLPNPTSDDIEIRICADEGTQNENTPIQLLEIYIQ